MFDVAFAVVTKTSHTQNGGFKVLPFAEIPPDNHRIQDVANTNRSGKGTIQLFSQYQGYQGHVLSPQ